MPKKRSRAPRRQRLPAARSLPGIAFLGLGIMGSGMAGSLLKAGYDVTVWNRTAAPARALVKKGARRACTIAQAVRGAQVVIYSLSDDAAIEQVVFGPGGVLSSVRRGQIVLDTSTIHPQTSRRQAAAYARRGVEFLDAPVFGSKNEAANAGLWIPVGGKRRTFTCVLPILRAISAAVQYMGPAGQGTSMKLVGNLVVALQLEAVGESMVLAAKARLRPRDVLRILAVADFRSPIISGVGAALARRDFATSFALKHLLKDANLIDRFAQDLRSPIPALLAVREIIKTAVNRGWGDQNASAFIKALEEQADVQVRG